MRLATFASFLALVASAPSVLAQDVADGLDAWRSAHGEQWRLTSSSHAGAERLLFGPGEAPPAPPGDDAQWITHGEKTLRAATALLTPDGLFAAESRVVHLPLALAGSTDKVVIRFERAKNGVPIRSAALHALFDSTGAPLALTGTALAGLGELATTPTNDAGLARAVASEAFRHATGLPVTEVRGVRLVIAPERGFAAGSSGEELVARLAWEVDVLHRTPGTMPEGLRFWIAAHGPARAFGQRSLVHAADVGGSVSALATPGLAPDDPGNPPVSTPMGYMTVSSPAGTVVSDEFGNFSIPGAIGPLAVTFEFQGTYNDVHDLSAPNYTRTVVLDTGTGHTVLLNDTAAANVTAQANVFSHINGLRDWVRAVLPDDGSMDYVNTANTNLNAYCNAFYDGVSTNYFRAGSGCPNTAYSTIVAHEQGHWLNDRYGSGNGPDGFGEGCADTFAMYYADSPVVGEAFGFGGGDLRTGHNLRQFCGDGNGGCHNEVHLDGEVLMGALWKVRENLGLTHGDAAGDAIADQLFLGWMNAFDQGEIESVIELQWLILDDDDGQLDNGSPHYAEIDSAFRVQGFPGHDLSVIRFEDPVFPTATLDDVGPYGVACTLTALTGSQVSTATVQYSVDGGPWQAVPMQRTGAGSVGGSEAWTALVPGVGSPHDVRLYVEAIDDLGNSATWPEEGAAAPHGFAVGERVVHFFDDFESVDDGGWTHGLLTVQDDWQHGEPQGLGGDPSSAFSGTQVWGNDLGAVGWNGLYTGGVINFLRSPFLDLSTSVGTTLEFARWLSVEQGPFDTAEVRVNGTTVWSNPTDAHLEDQSWQTMSLDVSAVADGNPFTQIEWRLETDFTDAFGGWNLDDVAITNLQASPTLDRPVSYGTPLSGSLGTPLLDSGGQPARRANGDFVFRVKLGPPAATAFLGIGRNELSAPVFGGTLLVDPLVIYVLSLDQFGQADLAVPIPDTSSVVGKVFHAQAFLDDPGAPQGLSMTAGLRVTIGS